MDASTRFWDRIADRYARKPVPDDAVYQHKLALTREYLAPDREVLEFGCGTGTTAIAHAPHVQRLTALDTSTRMVAIARDKAARAGVTNLEVIQGDLLDQGLDDASLDVILGMSILHLLPDRAATLACVHRLLKPGGVFISSTVCLGDTAPFFRFIAPVGHGLRLMPRVSVLRRTELVAELEAIGFRIERDWVPDSTPGVCFLVARKTRA